MIRSTNRAHATTGRCDVVHLSPRDTWIPGPLVGNISRSMRTSEIRCRRSFQQGAIGREA
jgi:hypothetical protein